MRLQPFKGRSRCQCSRFLCVPVAGCPLLGHRAAGQRVGSSCPARSHCSGQTTAWCKSRWWCWDCLVLFRGGMEMAQRFYAWLPQDKLLPEQQACAITILAGGPATPIQPQRMYNKIHGRPAGKLHTGPTSKKTNALFSKHISKRRCIAYAFNVKKIIIARAGQNRFMRRREILAWFLQAFILVWALSLI